MEVLPILGPDGVPTFRFDGARMWKQRIVKDYVVSLEWFGSGRHVDACMVIWSAKRSHDAGAYVIARRQIHLYTDKDMKATPYAFAECAEALPVLGRASLSFELHALIDVILSSVDDLIHMPVAPTAVKRDLAGEAVWEVEHKDKATGKVLRESTI